MRTTILAMLALALLTLTTVVAFGQHEPVIEWDRTYGGLGFEMVSQVKETEDGGYIIVGHTESYGAGKMDAWLIKTDSNGNETWNKTFGGFADDRAYSVQPTKDGGYIITGGTESYGIGNSDVWLIKTDSFGEVQWDKTFGGPGFERGSSVLETNGGGYIIVGGTGSYGAGSLDIWLINVDPKGNEIWSKTFGGSDYEWGHSAKQTMDGGYIITGPTHSYDDTGNGDFWLIKTDSEGNQEWNKTFGGPDYESSYAVQTTKDGGYIIVGNTQSFGAGDQDIWVVKTDDLGSELWNKTFGGTYFEGGSSVLETKNGNYIIAGHTESYGYLPIAPGPTGRRPGNALLIKTDSEGNEVWNKTFSDTQDISSVQETKDGEYIIVADTHSGDTFVGIWMAKIYEK